MTLPENLKSLNLGCGLSVAPGWINIDNSPNARLAKYPLLRKVLWKLGLLSELHYAVKWPASVVTCDLRKRLPYADSTIDYVYTSHFLEHLSQSAAQKLLVEVFRVMKPGGLLRVVVPDLAIAVRQYVAATQANPHDANAATEFLHFLQLSRPGTRDPHLWMYDAPSLAAMLHDCGFIKAVVCEYKKGRMPDCDILDNRPSDSLHLEAEKP